MNEDKEKDGQEIDESNEVTEPSHEDNLNTAETPTTETEEDPENGAEVGGEKNDGEEEEAPKEDGKTQGQTNYNRANKIDNNYYKISLLDKEQVTQLYKALSGKTEEGFSNRFSMKMLDIIQGKEIAISSTKSSFIAEDSWYQRGITILKEHRVLLLEGAKKDGVSDIALWMAYKMNKSKDVDTIYLSEAMGAQVRINLNKDIAENKEAFQNSVVLLEEAIKKNNKDLNTFLQKTASSKSSIGTHLKSKLKAINSFLILTLERNEIARYTGLAEKVNTITIPSLSDDKKQEYLTFKLRALQQKGTLNQNQKDAIDNVSQNEINTIVKQLPNINDLDRFVIRIEEKLILSGENLLDPKAVLGIIQSLRTSDNG